MPTHGLFLDDSGTKEYDPERNYSASNTRYFTFAGLLCTVAEAKRIQAEIDALKVGCFGRTDVEVKSNWLRREIERQAKYIRPHRITAERLTCFTDDLYRAILGANVKLLACIVDKVHMQEDYKNPYYTYAIAYEYVLQRAQNEMADVNGRVAVVIDNMDGATPAGRQYRANLKAHHATLRKFGSRVRRGFTFPNVDAMVFRNSEHDNRVQLADLVAYVVYRQFVDHGEAWEVATTETLSAYEYFARVAPRFRCDAGGRIQGFGVVKAPLRNRVPWTLKKKAP